MVIFLDFFGLYLGELAMFCIGPFSRVGRCPVTPSSSRPPDHVASAYSYNTVDYKYLDDQDRISHLLISLVPSLQYGEEDMHLYRITFASFDASEISIFRPFTKGHNYPCSTGHRHKLVGIWLRRCGRKQIM